MTVPYSFGAATSAIPLSQLDSNFNTPITLGNTAIQLGNTVTTLNNMTLANVNISSGNVTITNVTVTTANATTVNTTTLIATTANVTTGNVTNLISGNVTLTGGSITGTSISGSTGSFTTLTTSGTVTLNGGVANGVAYLDGSKVLTTGSALTFDGTNFGVGISTPSALIHARKDQTAATYVMVDNAGSINANTSAGFACAELGSVSAFFRALRDGSGNVQLYNVANAGLLFGVNNSEKMRLTSTSLYTASGVDVGIGTSSPAFGAGSGLEIERAGVATLRLENSTAGNNFELYSDSLANGINLRGYNNAPMVFWTNNTDRMRLDSSGNLGLGVTPSAWNSSYKAFQFGAGSIASVTTGEAAYLHNAFINSGGNYAYVNSAAAARYSQAGGVHYWFNAASGNANDTINFTQAMTLDASGNLLVGTTSQPVSGVTARLAISQSVADYSSVLVSSQTTAANCYGARIQYTGAAPNGTGNPFLVMLDTGGDRAVFRSNGGLANYSANDVNLSDRREKTNFAPAKSYLDTICAIPVQTFNYIDQSEDDPGLTLGVVAQDVQAVAPELVMESNWGTEEDPKIRLSIYQTDLQYALMKCIQELKAEFDAYKATHP